MKLRYELQETRIDWNQRWMWSYTANQEMAGRTGSKGRFHYGLVLFTRHMDLTLKWKVCNLKKKHTYIEGSKGMKCGIERTVDLLMNEASRYIPVWWSHSRFPEYNNTMISVGQVSDALNSVLMIVLGMD